MKRKRNQIDRLQRWLLYGLSFGAAACADLADLRSDYQLRPTDAGAPDTSLPGLASDAPGSDRSLTESGEMPDVSLEHDGPTSTGGRDGPEAPDRRIDPGAGDEHGVDAGDSGSEEPANRAGDSNSEADTNGAGDSGSEEDTNRAGDEGPAVAPCDAGLLVQGDSCIPVAPPRLLGPLSTSTARSRHPTLRWALAAGSDGAHVDICRDRSCATLEASFDAVGSQGAPQSDLPVGVHFWRAFGRSQGVTGLDSSAVWQFNVGARSAPLDTSWGSTLDMNGDGYADLLVGAQAYLSFRGRAYLYGGSSTGLENTPRATFAPSDLLDYSFFGYSVASAGDVNGDGYADAVVGAPFAGNSAGRADLFFGGPSNLATTISLPSLEGTLSSFGLSLQGAGDVNGDGYADVIIGSDISGDGLTRRAYVLLGGPSGLSTSQYTTISDPENDPLSKFGSPVAGAGDVDGDGYADVLVGAQGTGSPAIGRVYLFRGSSLGIQPSPQILVGPDGQAGGFGFSIFGGADINGDGYADVGVGAPHVNGDTGRVHIYFGGPTGLTASPALDGPDGPSVQFGQSCASAGDVNGDGFDDIILGSSGTAPGGRAYVYFGSSAGLSRTAPFFLRPANFPDAAAGTFGYSVAGAGDINGDGLADFVVTYPYGNSSSSAYVYFGSSSAPAPSPSILIAPDPDSGFGVSVASARRGGGGRSVASGVRRSRPVFIGHSG